MPDIDVARWTRLLEELSDCRARRRGLVEELTSLQQRQSAARNQLGRLEATYTRRFGPLAEDATLDAFPTYPARPGQALQRGQIDEAKPVLSLRSELRDMDRQAERLEQRLAPLRARFGELDRLYRRCLAWAAEAGVQLPGASGDDFVLLPTLPAEASRGQALNLGTGVGNADALAAAGPLASTARPGFLSAARGWFGATP